MKSATKTKTRIALTASQYFDAVYPRLAGIVDAIELRSLDAEPAARTAKRIVHLNGFINDEFDEIVTPVFLEALAERRVESLSFDLGPSCERVKTAEFYKPAAPVLPPDRIIEIGRRRLERIRSVYHGAISLENLDYHPGGAYEHVCEAPFIRRALREFDAGLTLDLGHANVTAFNKGIAVKDYICELPLERVVEVHLSHAIRDDDAHGVPTAEDYELLEYILSLAAPRYVVLEYFRDPAVIIEQVKYLRAFIDGKMAD